MFLLVRVNHFRERERERYALSLIHSVPNISPLLLLLLLHHSSTCLSFPFHFFVPLLLSSNHVLYSIFSFYSTRVWIGNRMVHSFSQFQYQLQLIFSFLRSFLVQSHRKWPFHWKTSTILHDILFFRPGRGQSSSIFLTETSDVYRTLWFDVLKKICSPSRYFAQKTSTFLLTL